MFDLFIFCIHCLHKQEARGFIIVSFTSQIRECRRPQSP